jgi:catechol 2,3-dioxygenase-like lactoylglutathione lyase family enzyme
MKIVITSVMVDDQDSALRFYTESLGFIKKEDIPMGGPRWLTVVSRHEPNGVQLLLEPDSNPALEGAGKNFKKMLFEKGIQWTSFAVEDVQKEYERLQSLGVYLKQSRQKWDP